MMHYLLSFNFNICDWPLFLTGNVKKIRNKSNIAFHNENKISLLKI